MAGDFNTDFNGDFSRVPYVATLSARITFGAAIAARHGVAAQLAATITLNAAIVAEVPGVTTATLDARVLLNADLRAAVPVIAVLNAELQIRADIRAKTPARRRPRAPGVGRRAPLRFPVPPVPEIPKPYVPPVRLTLAATIVLKARISARFAPPPMLVAAPPPELISARLVAGLTLQMHVGMHVPFVDGDDEELIFILAAAA